MTNKISIVLVCLIVLAFAADAIWFGGGLPLFLGKQLVRAVDYIAFWR